MKILIIGGTGLISTAITRKLLERGDDVTLFNRGRTTPRFKGTVHSIVGDRNDYERFEAAFSRDSFDVVIDMVSFHPDQTASAIRAFRGRTKQFVHCSTVCVYSGPVTRIPTLETEPYHSIGQYGKNKILCENLLFEAHKKGEIPVTVMRPSHSYGEGGQVVRPFGRHETFIDRLRKGKPVFVPGDGTGLWAACYVDDVAEGFVGVLLNDRCLGEAYQITGDEYMTWNTYYEQAAQAAGGVFVPVNAPLVELVRIAPDISNSARENMAWPSIFDNSKIKAHTGYRGQTVSWSEGVKRNIDWLDKNGLIASSESDTYEDAAIERWKGAMDKL